MLPAAHPAETLNIDPEGLEIANCYLQTQSLSKVAEDLGISTELVATQLNRREVKSYIDQVFKDVGFNNRFKMRKAMDMLISKKFQELDEAGVGSSKDIADLLALSHKMTMEQLDREIQLEKVRGSNIKSQVNVQINDGGSSGSNYGSLLEKLLKSNA
jgi:DNA-binding CsgD family transcriptional regulator